MTVNPYQTPTTDLVPSCRRSLVRPPRWTIVPAILCWLVTIVMVWAFLSYSLDLMKSELLGISPHSVALYAVVWIVVPGGAIIGTTAFLAGCRWYRNGDKLAMALTFLTVVLYGGLVAILSAPW